MTRRINYEDDIFTVALQVRCLQDTLKLEVDPELFKDRLLGDIAWIDAVIGRLYESLRDSALFVKRQEYLREMQKLKKAFIEALDALLERRAPFAQHMADQSADLRARRDAQASDIDQITALLSDAAVADEEHIVSQEELRFLMTSEDEDEER